MNKQKNIELTPNQLEERELKHRNDLFMAKMRREEAKYQIELDFKRKLPEVTELILSKLKELNQSKLWFTKQMNWARQTLYSNMQYDYYRPSEVKRIEAIFEAEANNPT